MGVFAPYPSAERMSPSHHLPKERASAKTLRWAEFGMPKNKHKASVIGAEWVEGWQDIRPHREGQGI